MAGFIKHKWLLYFLGLLCYFFPFTVAESIQPLFLNSNHTSVFARHSMLGMLLLNSEGHRYVAQLSAVNDPPFCSNFSLSADTVLFNFLQYSGKSPNDLGQYDDCRYTQESSILTNYSLPQYSLFQLSYMQAQFKWGFCYPAVCHQTLNDTVTQSASLLGFKIEFEMVDDFEPFQGIQIYSIITIAFSALLILLAIIGTLIHLSSIGNKDTPSSNMYQFVEPPHSTKQTNPLENKVGISKFLTCFSLSYNVPRLLTRERKPSPTDVLDGIRVLSLFWVVFGHCYIFPLIINANNQANAYLAYTQQFFFTIVTQAVLAVDVFFFLSAFLATYILLTKLPASSRCQLSKVPFLYLRRFYRLTPLLAFIIYFSAYIVAPLTDGPMRQGIAQQITDNCKDYGWATILYFNNYYPDEDGVCLGWTWYLSIEMHLFLLLPLYVIIYKASSLAGYLVLSISMMANWASAFYVSYTNKLGVGFLGSPQVDYFKIFYTRFYIRSGAYFVGILFALLYYNYRSERMHRSLVAEQEEENGVMSDRYRSANCAYALFQRAVSSSKAAWAYLLSGVLLTSLCVFLVYQPQKSKNPEYWPLGVRAVFNASERPLFVTGIALILIPLLSGRFYHLRRFLGHQFFVVLSRFSYSVYLFHEVVLIIFLGSSKSTLYFTHLEAVVMTFSTLVLAYISGGVLTLLVESPLSNIDKHFLFKESKKKRISEIK